MQVTGRDEHVDNLSADLAHDVLALDLRPEQRSCGNDHGGRPSEQDLVAGLQLGVERRFDVLTVAKNPLDDHAPSDLLFDLADAMPGAAVDTR